MSEADYIHRAAEGLRSELAAKKELQDLLVKEIEQKTLGDIEEKLRKMMYEVTKTLDRLKSYNEILNKLIDSQNKILKRVAALEEENDSFKQLKALTIGISVLAGVFTAINGAIAIAKMFR